MAEHGRIRRTAEHGGSATREDDAAVLAGLVELSIAGDPDAVVRIVELCAPMVVAVARRHLVNRHDVEDVVQDVWLALAQHLPRLTRPRALRAWLVTVTTHLAWRSRRRTMRQVPTGRADDRASDDDTETLGVVALEQARVHAVIGTALDRLRATDRRLLTLLAASDCPDYRAVSRLVGRPIGSIGPTRQRALGRLRRDPSIQALKPDVALLQ